MGIIDTLKNLFKQEKKPEQIKIDFSNLTNFIKEQEQENQTKNQDFLNSINQLIQNLIENLKPKINVLKSIDLTEKKTEERVKLIVKQNLDNYINHLEKLITDFKTLTETDEANPESKIKKINFIFNNFEKNSSMSYQKATFIVGKEIENVVNTLATFSKNFQTILKENNRLISTCQIFNIVKKQLNEFKKIEETKQEIISKMNKFKEEIEKLKIKKEILNKEIKEIKDSKEYKNELQQNQFLEDKKMQLEKSTLSLKQLIDFKSLANYCHSNEREMNIIKEYKDNFLQAFQKDNKIILNLLSQAKLSKPEIEEKTEQINNLQKMIKELEEKTISTNQENISSKQLEIEQIESETNSKINQIIKENKRVEKNKNNTKDIVNKIRQQLLKINVEIIPLSM